MNSKKQRTKRLKTEEVKSLNILNDGCLVHIFSFLNDIDDLLTVEKVCKRWRRIMSSSPATWKTVWIDSEYSHDYLSEILQKCGSRVVDLHVSFERDFEEPEDVMPTISGECDKLLHLSIFYWDYYDMIENDLDLKTFPWLKNLKSLRLQQLTRTIAIRPHPYYKKFLNRIMTFIKKAKNLEQLDILESPKRKIIIDKKMKELSICNIGLEENLVNLIFKRFPEIITFKVYYKYWGYFAVFNNSPQISKLVNYLNLKNVTDDEYFKGEVEKLRFDNLKELVIENSREVTDDVFKILLSNSPALEVIDLYDNIKLTDPGYRHLEYSKRLIKLSLRKADAITGSSLVHIAQNCKYLQEIISPESPELLSSELINIVNSLQDLKLIRIVGFKNFTRSDFEVISQSVEKRLLNVNLVIEFLDATPGDAEKLGLVKKESSSEQGKKLTITVICLDTDEEQREFNSWRYLWKFSWRKQDICGMVRTSRLSPRVVYGEPPYYRHYTL